MIRSDFTHLQRTGASHCVAWLVLFVGCVAITRAAGSRPPRVVLISGEYEYGSMLTFPVLKQQLQDRFGFDCVYLQRSAEEHIPGLEAIDQADLLITMIRRMTLPPEELGRLKRYFEAGRPLVGLRNTCHAFENWPEFVSDVLGGNYRFPPYQEPEKAVARVHAPARGDPLLVGVPDEFETGWRLYKTLPLSPASKLLLVGTGPKLEGAPEPIAWTHAYRGGRIFFASLGHPTDFRNPAFQRLLLNAIHWALGRSAPPGSTLGPFSGLAVKTVGLGDFENMVAFPMLTIVDVRPAFDYAGGHVTNSVNIDFDAPDFSARAAALDRAKPYVLYGDTNRPSAPAAARLHKMGFEVVYDSTARFSEWKAAGKSIAR